MFTLEGPLENSCFLDDYLATYGNESGETGRACQTHVTCILNTHVGP